MWGRELPEGWESREVVGAYNCQRLNGEAVSGGR